VSNSAKPPTTFHVVPADNSMLGSMAECHRRSFPGFFMTLLGDGCLRLSYKVYNTHPDALSLVAIDSETGAVIGLVAGGAPEVRTEFARRHVLRLVLAALRRSLTNAFVRGRFLHHITGAIKTAAVKCRLLSASATDGPPAIGAPGSWASLFSICTHPDHRGRGIGAALIQRLEAECAQRGFRTLRLSVLNDNLAARAFYETCGWTSFYSNEHGTYYVRTLKSPAESG